MPTKIVNGKRVTVSADQVGTDLPPIPVFVPQVVSNFQGRTMLRNAGLFDAVQAAITAISDPAQQAIAQDAFDRASFTRDSPLLLQISAQLGKDDAFIDQMFIDGAKVQV